MHPPIQSNLFIQKSITERPRYAEFKKILLDWTVRITNAIIDGTRSAEDARTLRVRLASCIPRLSEPSGLPLRILKVEAELYKYSFIAIQLSGNDDSIRYDIGFALGRGASQKDFEDWTYGDLGKYLADQVESILGKDWQYK
jgi:hypothetical protein